MDAGGIHQLEPFQLRPGEKNWDQTYSGICDRCHNPSPTPVNPGVQVAPFGAVFR